MCGVIFRGELVIVLRPERDATWLPDLGRADDLLSRRPARTANSTDTNAASLTAGCRVADPLDSEHSIAIDRRAAQSHDSGSSRHGDDPSLNRLLGFASRALVRRMKR